MQADIVFRPWMLERGRTQELLNKRVRLSGVMLAGDRESGIRDFVLLRNKECKFGPGGQADHLVMIYFREGVTATYTDRTVYVDGILKFKPFEGSDGNTWAIYEMDGLGFSRTR
jgi:hypothetical protein